MVRLALLAIVLASCSGKAGGRVDGGPGGDGPATSTDSAVDVPVKTDTTPTPPGARAARLSLSASDVDLGTASIGLAPTTGIVVVTNTGDAMSGPLAAMVTAPADFHPSNNCMGRTLGPSETCVVTIAFQPTSVGMKMGSGKVNQTQGDPMTLSFTFHGVGRLAPDAGPDVARDVTPSDALRDATADQAEAPRPEPPPVDARADARD
jgi:hypothetical protein